MTVTEKEVIQLAKAYAESIRACKKNDAAARSRLLRAEIALLDKASKLSSSKPSRPVSKGASNRRSV